MSLCVAYDGQIDKCPTLWTIANRDKSLPIIRSAKCGVAGTGFGLAPICPRATSAIVELAVLCARRWSSQRGRRRCRCG